MKAAVYRKYGAPDVLQIEDVERPVPNDDRVLVRVRAASLNPLDSHLMRGRPPIFRLMTGFPNPKAGRPGVDVAGTVEAVGRNVTEFKPGDDVFGACEGACAEFVVTREKTLVAKPNNITHEEAAAAPVAALTALQGLRDKARLRRGQSVLIHGAAGGCGTFAVQVGKWLGAEVTGVCRTQNVELVRSLGANHVIDYTREDFTKLNHTYDVIFDLVSDHTLRECFHVLRPNGILLGAGILGKPLSMGAVLSRPLEALKLKPFSNRKFSMFVSSGKKVDLVTIGELLRTGEIRSVIDRRYALDQTADALRYLEQKHARGKVVITV